MIDCCNTITKEATRSIDTKDLIKAVFESLMIHDEYLLCIAWQAHNTALPDQLDS